MNTNIKKNILDLKFQKNLIIASTSIVILFGYLTAFSITLLTSTIKSENYITAIFILSLTALISGLCIFFFFKSLLNIKRIPKIIENLEKHSKPYKQVNL